MAISGVNPKCYILALFVRDDGARFLLGDDPFEFKDNQLHFQQNTMANDVVEVQGNDGYLLAGQVRRPGTQMFDGYVCNGTNSKEEVEVKRRAFLQFFRRSHFYKVIYIFPNGTAIQRKQGFLVDDPTVQELYQQYPEYHVALNFEDVNYYTYEEDDQGQEIYAKEAIVPLAGGGATGGLIWDEYGVVWEDPWSLPLSISGVQFQILNNAGARAPIDNVELYGNTYQQTTTGKNLLDPTNLTYVYANSPSQIILSTIDGGIRMVNNGGASQDRFAVFKSVDLTPYVGKVVRMKATFGTGGGIRLYRIASDGSGRSQQATTTTSDNEISFTVPTGLGTSNYLGYVLDVITGGGTAVDFTNLNLTVDNALEPFEPYTGGQPAPNPDYPQAVQTVTGEQTVEVTGKNKFNTQNLTTNWRTTIVSSDNNNLVLKPNVNGSGYLTYVIDAKPSTTYTISLDRSATGSSDGFVGNIAIYRFNGTNQNAVGNVPASTNTFTFTTASDTIELRFLFYSLQTTDGTWSDVVASYTNIQVEESDEKTSYQPYQSQSYTIDLGSIELYKIGDYQDKIFNNDPNEDWYDPELEDNEWYVHKEFGKYIFNGTETIAYNSSNKGFTINPTNLPNYMPNHATPPMVGLSTHFSVNSTTSTWTGDNRIGLSSTGTFWCKATSFATSQSDCLAWLTANTPSVYYALNTATDTKITDATLVGQLEALGAMKLFIGENNVLVSATEPNLPATLAFDYYTKFAAIGAEWEEGGTKGATIVNVDAIDNTYPVWELTGPATNPTLSVLTTNTALTYNGTITASQKLVIDMFNKTATLNGTSVIGNISGDFVYMAPGTNRLAYTAGNTDAPDSTIYWQEVVG